ncbi:hypothetical protein HDU93_004065, partial [Gonapodya sp. JEL0774]
MYGNATGNATNQNQGFQNQGFLSSNNLGAGSNGLGNVQNEQVLRQLQQLRNLATIQAAQATLGALAGVGTGVSASNMGSNPRPGSFGAPARSANLFGAGGPGTPRPNFDMNGTTLQAQIQRLLATQQQQQQNLGMALSQQALNGIGTATGPNGLTNGGFPFNGLLANGLGTNSTGLNNGSANGAAGGATLGQSTDLSMPTIGNNRIPASVLQNLQVGLSQLAFPLPSFKPRPLFRRFSRQRITAQATAQSNAQTNGQTTTSTPRSFTIAPRPAGFPPIPAAAALSSMRGVQASMASSHNGSAGGIGGAPGLSNGQPLGNGAAAFNPARLAELHPNTFERVYLDFMKRRGCALGMTKAAIVGKVVDLRDLLLAVIAQGGGQKVNDSKKWKQISVALGFTASSAVSAGLRKCYSILLQAFEDFALRNVPPEPMGAKDVSTGQSMVAGVAKAEIMNLQQAALVGSNAENSSGNNGVSGFGAMGTPSLTPTIGPPAGNPVNGS